MTEGPVEERLLRSKFEHQEKLRILREQQTPHFQPYLGAKSRILAQNIKIKECSKNDQIKNNQSYIDMMNDFQFQPKSKIFHKRSETPVFISKISPEIIYRDDYDDDGAGAGKVLHTFM